MGTDDYIIDANGSWSSPQEALEWYRAQLATERAALQANSTCIWQQDGEGSDLWQTSCHQAFTINDGDPSDNSMAYCCFCGRRLEESLWPEAPDEEPDEEPAP